MSKGKGRLNTVLRNLRDRMVFVAVVTAFVLIRILPFRVMRALGDCGGNVMWFLLPPVRKLVLANLNIAFPEKMLKERKRIGRMSLQSLCKTALESFWFAGSKARCERYAPVDVQVMKTFLSVRTEKGGGIAVASHFGNWEMAAFAFTLNTELKMGVIARPFDNPYLNRLMEKLRSRMGNEVISVAGAGKGMIRYLRSGDYIGTLIDQNTNLRDGGVFVDFFGLPVPVSRAPAMFGIKMGSGLVASFCRRTKAGFDFHVFPLYRKDIEALENDETAVSQELIRLTQEFVRQNPEQYLWFYRRYRFIDVNAPEAVQKAYPAYSRVPQRYFYERNKTPNPPTAP